MERKQMTSELRGKVALVTGGAVRVGRAISLGLAEAGCDLFLHYGRSAGPAREVRQEAAKWGAKVEIFSADLADAAAVREVVPAAIEAFGRVDILVNSAALFLDGGLMETTLSMWERQFAVNLRAPFLLCQAFARQSHFTASEPGKIVNIGDARVFRPAPDHFAYRLTRSALFSMTQTLAKDLAPAITVNGLALGAILPPPGEDVSYLERLAAERIPLRRPGSAELVAENVLHLVKQSFITGHIIQLDGGEFL